MGSRERKDKNQKAKVDMQIINDTKVYTLSEIAELIGVTYSTAQRYVKLGRIPAARSGRSWLVTEYSLLRFLNGETYTPQTKSKGKDEAKKP